MINFDGDVSILSAQDGKVLGTIAMEGAFEVMQTGYCDSNWAEEHHDLWYENVKDSGGMVPQQTQGDSNADGMQKESTDTA